MAMFENLLDRSDGIGLSFASVLLQLHLMATLAFWFVGSVLGSSSESTYQKLRASSWQATLGRACDASGPARLVAVFALIQARGGASDVLTSYGLYMTAVPVCLITLFVVLIPGCGSEVPEVNASSGDVEETNSQTLGMLCKVLSAVRAVGQLLLIFAAPPQGLQLICASVLVRFAFLLAAVGSLARFCGSTSEARDDALRVLGSSLAPMVGSLALLDHVAWGPSSYLLAPLQPVLYCSAAALAQVSLVFSANWILGGRVEEAEQSESADFDFKFELGEDSEADGAGIRLETLRQITAGGFFLALLLGLGRVSLGVFGLEFGMKGACVKWGEPAAAMAVVMYLIQFAVFSAQYCVGTGKASEGGTPGVMYYAKLLMEPVSSLIIALVCAHMTIADQPPRESWEAAETSEIAMEVAQAPLRYGFILAAFAVIGQVKLMTLRSMMNGGASQMPFDCTGTVKFDDMEISPARAVMSCSRWMTVTMLLAGVLLGCIGLGALTFGAALLALGSLFVVLPSASKQIVGEVFGMFFAVLGSLFEVFGMFFGMFFSVGGAFMENQRLQKEAAAAKHAAGQAAEMEAEAGGAAAKKTKGKAPAPKKKK